MVLQLMYIFTLKTDIIMMYIDLVNPLAEQIFAMVINNFDKQLYNLTIDLLSNNNLYLNRNLRNDIIGIYNNLKKNRLDNDPDQEPIITKVIDKIMKYIDNNYIKTRIDQISLKKK